MIAPEPCASIDGFQVEIHLMIPCFLIHLDRAAPGRAADVIDQNINASEPLNAGFDHCLDLSTVGDIAKMGHDFAADGMNPFQSLCHRLRLQIDGKYFRPFFSKADTLGTPVAPARPDASGPCDNRNFACQST
jgi:hypothetical protein